MMQLPAIELQANDCKHEDGKEEQETNLQQWHHGLDYRLQDYLQALQQTNTSSLVTWLLSKILGLHGSPRTILPGNIFSNNFNIIYYANKT